MGFDARCRDFDILADGECSGAGRAGGQAQAVCGVRIVGFDCGACVFGDGRNGVSACAGRCAGVDRGFVQRGSGCGGVEPGAARIDQVVENKKSPRSDGGFFCLVYPMKSSITPLDNGVTHIEPDVLSNVLDTKCPKSLSPFSDCSIMKASSL